MKKKGRFGRSLLIYTAVLAVIIIAGLIVLWRFMDAYELSQPDNTVNDFVESKDTSFWADGVDAAIADGGGEFDLKTATAADYGINITDSSKITCSSDGSDGGTIYYAVKADGVSVCRLALAQGESVGFGMSKWTISSYEFEAGDATTLRVIAPSDAAVTINGVEVTEKYATNKAAEIECELEIAFDVCPTGTEYTVTGLRGPLELAVTDSAGNALDPVGNDKGLVCYAPKGEYSFNFYASADAVVSVNGTDITGQYTSETDTELCDGFSEYMTSPVTEYSCDKLMCEPQITVTDALGNAIEPVIMSGGGKYYVSGASAALSDELNTFVEGFARAYITFSTNLNKSPYSNYSALSTYLLSGTELETNLYNTIANIVWVSSTQIEYQSLSAYDYVPRGDGCFSCTVSYEITNHAGSGTRDIASSFTLLAVRDSGGAWKVASMITA